MAREPQLGEQVTVKNEVHLSSNSEAYKKGLEKIIIGEVGEVVGQAPGRALTVRFSGIDTVIAKQSLVRLKEPSPQKKKPAARKGTPKATKKPTQPKAVPQAEASPRPGQPQSAPTAPITSAHESEESVFQLLNAVANKLLLGGGTHVDQDGLVELSLKDLPADVRARLQALIDAKLAFNPKDLGRK